MSATAKPAKPRLYLNTPFMFEPKPFAEALAEALDAGDVACLRLRLRGASEDELKYAVETLRPVCHQRDVAIVLSDFFRLAAETGLDGVHFELGSNAQREARELLGPDAIIGVSCGASRHLGLVAGERGADYVAFGPVSAAPSMQAGEIADAALFHWWQSMIEVPVVAEGGMTPEIARQLAPHSDFICASRSVWRHPDGPAAGVRAYLEAITP